MVRYRTEIVALLPIVNIFFPSFCAVSNLMFPLSAKSLISLLMAAFGLHQLDKPTAQKYFH
ncbi:MAG: hypothetical protein QM530_00260 [Phycisphaerales bacterium]|nr:hypothetical protein [Phycisphaerales bacterium]